ncbi:MAG: bifunctional folylpolyglutamate synthase/dihydrofolate synthase [Ruminococcaceae bacterium]|nr:bifunctional folylpolyglutamate synthase/dihydrofolate synthase [Oscillospiraceae bacterium]
MACFNPVDYINSKLVFGSKPGLERITCLLERLGNPQKDLKFIHIAGTNGKGSTASYIAEILKEQGLKTGLYISPYVNRFEERISIDGQFISYEDLKQVTEYVKPFCEELAESPTEFELITAIAFLYFKNKGCDVVVLETGLGGRFDATNVIEKPLMSVIASISFDHMQYLGDTLSKIAFEKCGIIKENAPAVCYPLQDEEALQVIKQQAENKKSKLFIPDIEELEIISSSIEGNDIVYKGMSIHIPLAGKHQIYNCITAIEAVMRVFENISPETIIKGIKNTKFPARLEIIKKEPLIIIDGAHNADGIENLRNNILSLLKGKKITVIMGMLLDKGYENAVKKIAPLSNTFIAITPKNPRAADSSLLVETAQGLCKKTIDAKTAEQAAKQAVEELKNNDVIIVCGSLYIAGEMKQELLKIL